MCFKISFIVQRYVHIIAATILAWFIRIPVFGGRVVGLQQFIKILPLSFRFVVIVVFALWVESSASLEVEFLISIMLLYILSWIKWCHQNFANNIQALWILLRLVLIQPWVFDFDFNSLLENLWLKEIPLRLIIWWAILYILIGCFIWHSANPMIINNWHLLLYIIHNIKIFSIRLITTFIITFSSIIDISHHLLILTINVFINQGHQLVGNLRIATIDLLLHHQHPVCICLDVDGEHVALAQVATSKMVDIEVVNHDGVNVFIVYFVHGLSVVIEELLMDLQIWCPDFLLVHSVSRSVCFCLVQNVVPLLILSWSNAHSKYFVLGIV